MKGPCSAQWMPCPEGERHRTQQDLARINADLTTICKQTGEEGYVSALSLPRCLKLRGQEPVRGIAPPLTEEVASSIGSVA